MTALVFEPTAIDVPRDRWGRPLVTPPGGGKPVAYRRATTFIDVLDDKHTLMAWKQRQTAVGLALRPDLHLAVSSYAAQPDDHKRQLDDLCDQAIEAAGASSKATTGTALHQFTERLDRGLDLGPIPADAKRHIDAYAAATAPLTALHIEQMTVCDDLQVAGTPDRIVTVDGIDGCFIADLKTGASTIKYGLAKVAAQMAIYAHSQLWNHETNMRTGVPGLSLTAGIVIVSDLDEGTCRLAWIDLAAGWEDVQIAAQVWRSHARRKDVKLVDIPAQQPAAQQSPSAIPDPTPAPADGRAVHAATLNAIAAATTVDELGAIWQQVAPTGGWDDTLTAAAAARKTTLTTTH